MAHVIDVQVLKRVRVFEASGRLDTEAGKELREKLDTSIDEGQANIVVDLGGAEYLSSSTLRVMVQVLKRAKRDGGDLRIANPSRPAMEVVELAGLESAFEIYPTQVDAVGSF